MSKKIRIAALLLAVLLLLPALASCGDDKDNFPDGYSVSLVLGAHKYFPAFTLNASDIYTPVYRSAYNYSTCSVIVVDGSPYLYGNYEISKPDKMIDNSKRKQLAKTNADNIICEALCAEAKTPETDTLSALTLAATSLRSSKSRDMLMIVCDNGLSTEGLINFAKKDIFNSDPEKIVNRLRELCAIPDTEGITVLWSGIGEVCGEQEELTAKNKNAVKTLWKAIIEAGGGTVIFDETPLSSVCRDDALPYCSTVTIIQDCLDVAPELVEEGEPIPTVKLDNETVKFTSDSAEFYDKDAALTALSPIITLLCENPGLDIVIAGTTASYGSEENCKALSLMRATAVKDLLTKSYGISPERIKCVGLGREEWSLRVDDLDESGNLTEPYASQNRAVYIIDAKDDLAQTLN